MDQLFAVIMNNRCHKLGFVGGRLAGKADEHNTRGDATQSIDQFTELFIRRQK